ncbi:hypothetical protein B0F90DRAFT_1720987 [Multifurca ochricompacta]|uniref:C2H2-type domain-containing protein n=1 Tax=Multifurca ochricompacta TaxID=376703 RepID=A0AAD4M604_9AGAM|nr:hypothetical protein B0F90DRAFT_1720987 [Multifurca ochricompacta]
MPVVSRIPGGYVQPPAILSDEIADISLGAPASNELVRDLHCPICGTRFNRPRDKRRHLLLYLSHWIYCQHPDCAWTGDRPDAFKTHWKTVHSFNLKLYKGSTIYDPYPLVDQIVENCTRLEKMQEYAASLVGKKALALGKWGVWKDSSKRRNQRG